ncbi:hypothetical protein ACFL9T_08120 [Thermodesulfobacteriota bacterium]
MTKHKITLLFVAGIAVVILLFGGVKQVVADSQVEQAWENIADQIRTYQVLDSLTGEERIRAARKVIFGIEQLRKDIDFFLENAPLADLRRPAVMKLKLLMEKSRSK